MLEKVLNYLKQTGLYFIAQPVSHWAGLLIGGILSFIMAILYQELPYLPYIETEMFFLCTLPFVCLFIFVYVVAYKMRQFSVVSVLLCLLPLFVVQHVYLFCFGPSSWLNGITANLSFIWFSNGRTAWSDALVQVLLQLFVHFPITLAAAYLGCRQGIKKSSE